VESTLPPASKSEVDFDRDIRTIFSERCLTCHGPAKQRSGLRLDRKEDAARGGNNGVAYVPGNSTGSLLIRYVSGVDPDIVMPPEGDRLTSEHVGLLRAWIDSGATWPDAPQDAAHSVLAKSDHWSFLPPVRPELPEVKNSAWPRNSVDSFILARLEKEGLAPSPEADRYTLMRRVTLDLTGLPPTPEEANQFALDSSPDAYEKLVDRLLVSPHFGERWARHWLDLARYADTNGYEKDRVRSIWPYRDWVIEAFNQDLPFNQFTIEQIAGDMLDNASTSQRAATGFHRNTMVNEEGGIDVEEFRYESVVDRLKTTGTVFLGLTVGCCQCHDHKYDPISQREYYQMFSFLNNADEPEMPVPSEEDMRKRAKILAKISRIEDRLEAEFPPYENHRIWTPLDASQYSGTGGALLTKLEDHSLLAIGANPSEATYQMVVETPLEGIDAFRVEALVEPRLDATGPGRAPNGNFVLSEFRVTAMPLVGSDACQAVEFATAEADVSQEGFPAAAAFDGDLKTGWAVDDKSDDLKHDRTALFKTKEKISVPGGAKLIFTLIQAFGGQHTLGRFRISAGSTERLHEHPELAEDDQRKQHLAEKLAEWEAELAPNARHWTILDPSSFSSENHATLTKLPDTSILATGDKPNRDTYRLEFETPLSGITALRLETLPHPSLPYNGPGRGNVMGKGDFMLSETTLAARPLVAAATGDIPGGTVEWQSVSEAPYEEGHTVEKSIDGVPDTGWTIKAGEGITHTAVFELKQPVGFASGAKLSWVLAQKFLHQSTIGRFRVSVTTDPLPAKATGLPSSIEAILATAKENRSSEQLASLKKYYLGIAPDLEEQHARIAKLRESIPSFPTTLVMQERALPRATHVHIRGEFLREGVAVTPGVPAILHPLPEGEPPNRLTFAKWLVDEKNPLVGRVIMNRLWQAYFGRGLVFTAGDFGKQGEPPSHPELLDWLATEFPSQGWSLKAMHRLIVTSATYRQASQITPDLYTRDPSNVLLARGPRFRVESEMVRDIALSSSGLLNPQIGGPSVFPPQPEGVTELAYGSPKWPASEGKDRYRRALYTHLKRTALYPGLTLFDTPPPDTTCPRRVRSNTPLQALTVLNDEVYVEAAKALAKRVVEEGPADPEGRIRYAFRLCLTRPPVQKEVDQLVEFHDKQRDRFLTETGEATKLASLDVSGSASDTDKAEQAAWTTVARVLLNLDETVTKE
jgi:hypothetical protein